MGKTDSETPQLGLIQRCEGGGQPGGASITLPKAVEMLRPKAVFCIGSCAGLHRERTRMGEVIAAAKLATYAQLLPPVVAVHMCLYCLGDISILWLINTSK